MYFMRKEVGQKAMTCQQIRITQISFQIIEKPQQTGRQFVNVISYCEFLKKIYYIKIWAGVSSRV